MRGSTPRPNGTQNKAKKPGVKPLKPGKPVGKPPGGPVKKPKPPGPYRPVKG